jgi:YD repeat protein
MKKKSKTNRISGLFAAIALCNAIAAVCMLDPFNASGVEISNDYLSLKVQDDADEPVYGGFMLMKNGDETSDTLTYSQFYSSFAAVNINGTVKLFSDGERVRDTYADSDGSVVTVQSFDGVEITQRLSFSTGESERADMLRIEYLAENKTDKDVLVSIRLIIDPTISDSESDPITVNGNVLENETALSGKNVPKTWCIKDEQDNITAYGITSDESSAPDIFQSANWNNLYNSHFAYTADSSLQIADNAAALTWSDRKIAVGENFHCSTKYGLYSNDGDSDSSSSGTGKNKNADSPKTGDNIGTVFAALAVCSSAAAVLSRKRRDHEDE